MARQNPLVVVFCERCGIDFEVPNNVATRARWCANCKDSAHKEYVHEREEKKREKRLENIRAREWNIGGAYHICKDPDQSFGYDSSFTFNEISKMIQRGYLAPGTEFRLEPSRAATHRVVKDGDGIRLINILKPNVAIGQKGILIPLPVFAELESV